ncbi:MAG: hypothetical protein ACK6AH_03460, partial [Gemmatimonadota bacterium]
RFLWSCLAPVAWNAARSAALLGWGERTGPDALVRSVAWGSGPVVRALLTLGTYGAAYLLLTAAAGVAEANALVARLRRR